MLSGRAADRRPYIHPAAWYQWRAGSSRPTTWWAGPLTPQTFSRRRWEITWASSSQSPHRCVLTSFASLAPPSRAGLVRSTVRPFPTRLVSLVGSPWLAGISHSAPLLVLSRRRRKLRIPHPAASGRLRPLRCSGSPSERRSAFRWVPHSAALGSRGGPDLRAKLRRDPHRPGGGRIENLRFPCSARTGRNGRGWSPTGA